MILPTVETPINEVAALEALSSHSLGLSLHELPSLHEKVGFYELNDTDRKIQIKYQEMKENNPCNSCNTEKWEEEVKKRESKERYDLFLNGLINYFGNIEAVLSMYEQIHGEENLIRSICPISHTIPTIPVVVPSKGICDKRATEYYIDQELKDLDKQKICFIESGYTEEETQRALGRILSAAGLIQQKLFTKKDLKYASDFAGETIAKLETVKDKLLLSSQAAVLQKS